MAAPESFSAATRDALWAAAQVPNAWARLHDIEQQIAENLMDRPLATWCPACFRIFERICKKAMRDEHGQ